MSIDVQLIHLPSLHKTDDGYFYMLNAVQDTVYIYQSATGKLWEYERLPDGWGWVGALRGAQELALDVAIYLESQGIYD